VRPVVYIASPWRGDTETHERYALAALADSLSRGEAPVASHLLYPRALDDDDPAERAHGMAAALALLAECCEVMVYADLGVSGGMADEIEAAHAVGKPVTVRSLPGWGARG
jgi:hypothetical protein